MPTKDFLQYLSTITQTVIWKNIIGQSSILIIGAYLVIEFALVFFQEKKIKIAKLLCFFSYLWFLIIVFFNFKCFALKWLFIISKKKINQKKRFISKNITNKFPDQKYYFAEFIDNVAVFVEK